MTWIMK